MAASASPIRNSSSAALDTASVIFCSSSDFRLQILKHQAQVLDLDLTLLDQAALGGQGLGAFFHLGQGAQDAMHGFFGPGHHGFLGLHGLYAILHRFGEHVQRFHRTAGVLDGGPFALERGHLAFHVGHGLHHFLHAPVEGFHGRAAAFQLAHVLFQGEQEPVHLLEALLGLMDGHLVAAHGRHGAGDFLLQAFQLLPILLEAA
jgi:hypothetical protein